VRLQSIGLIIAVAGLATIAGIRVGQAMAPNDSEYATLTGLSGVYVRVAKPKPHEAAAGLSEKELQQDLEDTLTLAGVRTLNPVEYQKSPGHPMLIARVSVLRDTADKAEKVNDVTLALVEDGTLVRNPKRKTPVIIYNENTFGVGSVADMRGALRGLAMQFATEYREQNSK
jgi:hypothetical protein